MAEIRNFSQFWLLTESIVQQVTCGVFSLDSYGGVLSMKAAKAHKTQVAFIFSVVLPLISKSTVVTAIQSLVVCVAGLWR